MTSGPSAGKTQVTSGGTDSRGLLSPGCDGSRLQARLSWRCQLGCRSAWTLRPAWPLSMVADRSRELGRSDKAISDPAIRVTLVSSMSLRQLRFKGGQSPPSMGEQHGPLKEEGVGWETLSQPS